MGKLKEIRAVEWVLAVLLLALPAVTFCWGRATGQKTPVEATRRDTVEVIRTDTLRVPQPVYRAITRVDTIRVPVVDTLRVRDTLYIDLPRTQAAYRDTLYEAWVSGYQPALDSIHVFSRLRCVTVTERVAVEVSRRWSLGLHAGYGVAVAGGKVQPAPYIGVGISYNLFSW